MGIGAEKNKKSWNDGAQRYADVNHTEGAIARIIENPAVAFHPATWGLIRHWVPELQGKKICVPSSGDNLAVFAFALLGAQVTSCDIAENQLENARRVAVAHGWEKSIEFVCADTMALEGVQDGAYDFVYTSNGVHVWIDDLNAMYKNIARVLAPGGTYILYEIHPFQRPFGDGLRVVKPYDSTGPFESDIEVTFGWRIMDILNALLSAGLSLKHLEEMFAQKDYDWPFFVSYQEMAAGKRVTREEVDRMYDWRHNPMAALPNWMSMVAQKG